jgi:hypothetical protein
MFFFVTQAVTESTRLPESLQTISLPFGHPVAILVTIWVARDLVRRLRSGTLLHVETGQPELGDGFEDGPEDPWSRELDELVDEDAMERTARSGVGGGRPRTVLDGAPANQRRTE